MNFAFWRLIDDPCFLDILDIEQCKISFISIWATKSYRTIDLSEPLPLLRETAATEIVVDSLMYFFRVCSWFYQSSKYYSSNNLWIQDFHDDVEDYLNSRNIMSHISCFELSIWIYTLYKKMCVLNQFHATLPIVCGSISCSGSNSCDLIWCLDSVCPSPLTR